jgi:hypothetical protein
VSAPNGGPAFPVNTSNVGNTGACYADSGMSLRDYFAAKALPAIVAAYVEANGRCVGTDHIHYNCAAHAYRMADAMLAERAK